MHRAIMLVVAIGLSANGLAMMLGPETWYGLVPGVTETGPFNPHFVRDVGAAYLVAAGGLLWFAIDARARAAALAGAAFLGLHGLVHLGEALAGDHPAHLARDLPGVFLPAALGLWLAWPRRPMNKERSNRDENLVDPALDRRI